MSKAPRSIRQEHGEILQFVTRLAREGGPTADAAQRLARLLETHMHKEEAFAAPPLALLPRIARDNIVPAMAETLVHADWLRENLDTMLAEHRMIAAALEELLKLAGPSPQPGLVTFAETVLNHARLEEEVLYPAAIVAGEYLKMRLGKKAALAVT